MPDTPEHELRKMLEAIKLNDAAAVDSITGLFGTSVPSIEQRLWLADLRAQDALSALFQLAKYIMDREPEATFDTTGDRNDE